jgi:hypothetical protein
MNLPPGSSKQSGQECPPAPDTTTEIGRAASTSKPVFTPTVYGRESLMGEDPW